MNKRNRRQFLEESMLAAAAAVTGAHPGRLAADLTPVPRSTAERLGVAILGVRGRGKSHIGFFAGRSDTEVLYLCDPDEDVGQRRAYQTGRRSANRRPQWVADFRRALDDPRVDVVCVATPNHWHALASIWAMTAGKDVYVEKPVSHNVWEGRRMVEVARRYQRICQAGFQARSNPGMIAAIGFVQEGRIGDPRIARGFCYKRRGAIGPPGNYPLPAGVDFNLWSGPAPIIPLTRPRFHHDWHWQAEYGNGDLGYQGVHQLDLCRWGMQLERLSDSVISVGGSYGSRDAADTPNTQVILHQFGSRAILLEVRGMRSESCRGVHVGVIFEGTAGYVVMTSYHRGAAFDLNGRQRASFHGGGGNDLHFRNFLQAVRTRNCSRLNADVEQGHLSSALCHTANISHRLGTSVPYAEAVEFLDESPYRTAMSDAVQRMGSHLRHHDVNLDRTMIVLGEPLRCDPDSEQFLSHPHANQMLRRQYRAGFAVPVES
jgi:predicted dehydrogenase